jgi:penicillin-binding protein 1A
MRYFPTMPSGIRSFQSNETEAPIDRHPTRGEAPMQHLFDKLRKPLWLGGVAWLAWWTWTTVTDVLATPLLAVPAALAFSACALLAGPPYRHRPPRRWAWRIRSVPKDVRSKMKYLGRIVYWRVERNEMPGKRFAFFRSLFLLGAILALLGAASLPIARSHFSRGLPTDLDAAAAYEPPVATRVYSRDGELICTFTTEFRVRVAIEDVPLHVQRAFIAAEDERFYEHHGFDPLAIARAAIVNHRSGDTRQGGSTITQQVVKLVVLRNSERTYRRKIQELLVAVELERRLPKDRILEIYLNHIFLGHGAYGIQAASLTYFGKDVRDLTLAEAAILAGLPQAPSRDSPYAHYDRARERMEYVLGRMVEAGYATRAEADRALEEEIRIIHHEDPLNRTAAPYVCEMTRRELTRMFGYDAVFEEGLDVVTTIDMGMQRAADIAVRRGLIDLERRIGWNGPEGHDDGYTGCAGPAEPVSDATVELGRVAATGPGFSVCVRGDAYPVHPDDLVRIGRWERSSGTRVAVGDLMSVRIETSADGSRRALTARRTGGPGHPDTLQAGLVSVDPSTGELRALVGGYDFNEVQFNHATQARRQTGSSIKPYVYLAALRRGMTVDERIVDRPVCYQTASGWWCPRNYRGPNTVDPYLGEVDLRTALARSLNSVSVQLLARVGVEEVIRTMRDLGIVSPLERVMPLAIGSADITLWEHSYAYAVIASGGRAMPRHPGAEVPGVFISRVTDRRGEVRFEHRPWTDDEWPQAVPSGDAYALTYLMRGVVEQGTGRRVREMRRPAAGKTGTTNDFRDVWFMGFTADLVTGVWVGRTAPRPIADEATGGSVALPIWLAYMRAAHPDTPPREFPVPDDVTMVPNWAGDLVPFQRGRLPSRHLVRVAPFTGTDPFE